MAPGGGLEEGSLFVPTRQLHTADTHCAGMAEGWAASPSHRTPGNAALAPYSSCWTGGEGKGSRIEPNKELDQTKAESLECKVKNLLLFTFCTHCDLKKMYMRCVGVQSYRKSCCRHG